MSRYAGAVIVLLIAVSGAGCAGPRTDGSGSAAGPPPAGIPELPPASTIASYPLVKDDPAIVTASRALDAAGYRQRPALLLARAKEAVAAGQRIRNEQGDSLTLTASAPDYQRFLAFYDLAYRDLEEIAIRHARAPEAPEGRYLLGLIHDYHHLDFFEEALSQYHRTLELYPGTPWAKKAAERIEVLEKMFLRAVDAPHGE